MRDRVRAGLADVELPFIDVRHRLVQLIVKPLSSPFLPIWAATKALEASQEARVYYVGWFILSTVLYAIGDDVRARLAEASDDSTTPNK